MKKWFDDWLVSYRPYAGKEQRVVWKSWGKHGEDVVKKYKLDNKPGRFVVNLPHSYGEKTKYVYMPKTKAESKRIYELVSIIDCCLYELTKKKWWEFWK